MAIIGSTAPAPSAIYVPGIGTPGRDGADGADGRDGRDGRDGSPGQGVIFTRTAGVGIPAWRALVANDDGSVTPADPSNTAHRGRVIGITARGASAGLQASIQNAGDLRGPDGGFAAGTPLFVGAGGSLTPTAPTSGWSQVVATAVSSSQIVVALGEAEVISSDGTALVVPTGFASAATPDDVAAGEDPSKFVTPPALAPVLSEKVGRTEGLKAALPFTAPSILRPLPDWIADLMKRGASLRALGFVGDGGSHPLSERFGVGAAGLAAAKAVFPRATSLSEEIDGHAIQKFIDEHHARSLNNDPLVVELPDGSYGVSSITIFTGKVATTVRGNNSYITWTKPGIDGWVHGTVASGYQALPGARFEMKGVNLCCAGVCGTALTVEQDPTTGGFCMDTVRIVGSGNSLTNYWGRAVAGTGTGNLRWEGVEIVGSLGGDLMTKGDGVYMTFDKEKFGDVQGAFFFRFNNCDISWYKNGINFLAKKTMEGIYIKQCNINSCLQAVKFHNTTMDNGGGYPSPELFIIDNQIECYGTYFDFKAVQNVKIKGNLFIVNAARPGVADPGAFLWDWLTCGIGCADISVFDNDFTFVKDSFPRYIFNVDAPGVLNINIYENKFSWVETARPGAGIINFGDAGNAKKNVREYNNNGLANYFWSVVNGTGKRSNGCFSEAAIVSALNGAGNGDELIEINHETGAATVVGTRSGVPTQIADQRFLYADIPSGTLSAPPLKLLASWGDDFGVQQGEVPVPSLAQSTATRLAIKLIGYSGTVARRVSFVVTS
ncbi:hypothetical protein HNR01_001798 [Methylorubrum rhodesianum]|uniref:hypothetical protein n=1 Tax=Methylorubrum rhodesianum TaxID=29427 RepID=UPI00160890CE|nr:hypothetical protein [Methylorubrum rhodesianum]MBB5762178.1 hypothetical protein [Methylorubrum rhodesianum]